MNPLDTGNRLKALKDEYNIGYCNITKCCTEVCPESIHITDNGIIPLKERVADDYFDPIRWIASKVTGGDKKEKARLPVLQNDGSMTVRATPASKRGE
jgi:succinate dehydrogenase / fumarate reductase iron-sulfur subunit